MTNMAHLAAVADQFGAHANAYVTSPTHAAGADLDQLETLLAARRPARVLDLGTGGGHVAYRAAPHAQEVVAYDLSAAMLAEVAAQSTQRGHANISTQQGAAESLPFADASFDAVLSRYSAHHWQDVPRALAEARRVLKPGGLAVFIDTVSTASPLTDTWLQTIELLRDTSHVRNYKASEWLAMLDQAGFAPKPVQYSRVRLEFASWVARSGTDAALVTAIRTLHQKAPAEVLEQLAVEPDGSFTIDKAVFEA